MCREEGIFEANCAVFAIEAHQPAPSVAAQPLFRDLQVFVDSHGADQFFSPPEEVREEEMAGQGEADAFEMFELPVEDGMIRVPTEDAALFTSRAQRLAACQGIGMGTFADLFKNSMEVMQKHAEEPQPVPSGYEPLMNAITAAKSLTQEHNTETMQKACLLLENLEAQLRGTEDKGASIVCLQVYNQFQQFVQKLADWEGLKYDRRSDSFLSKYEAAYRNVEKLLADQLNSQIPSAKRLDPLEVKNCQDGARALGPLLEEYSKLWGQLGR